MRKFFSFKSLCLLLIAFAFVINLAPSHLIDHTISDSKLGFLSSCLYNACEESGFVAISVLVLCYTSCFIILGICFFQPTLSIIFAIISLLSWVWITFDDFWKYPRLPFGLDMRWWLATGCCICWVLLSLIALDTYTNLKSKYKKSDTKTSPGFTSIDENISGNLEDFKFADKLIKKISDTNVDHCSFAIGIVGEWGSGKTTFLNTMKRALALRSNAVIIDFNPWRQMSGVSIVKAFMSTLSSEISKNITPSLAKPLKEYADALISISQGTMFSRVVALFISNESETDLKQQISSILRKNHHHIYIFIDDIDRLASDELFEVLRLIRISADFPHVYYIVAYDRTYMVSELEAKRISNPQRYIEKIFNAEISIPKASDSVLRSFFVVHAKNSGLDIDEAKLNEWAEVAVHYLPTYRDIKRFIGNWSVTESHMAYYISEYEYSKDDLFYMELLKYSDPEMYTRLRDYPNKILVSKIDSDGLCKFLLPKSEDKKIISPGVSMWLLEKIFGDEKCHDRSPRYVDSFHQYFSYRFSDYTIRSIEFQCWCNEDDPNIALTKFEELKERSYRSQSLLFQIAKIKSINLTQENFRFIVSYLLDILLKNKSLKSSVGIILVNFIKKACNSPLIDIDTCCSDIESIFRNKGNSYFVEVAIILKNMRSELSELIAKVRSLEISNFTRYLQSNHPNPVDMSDKETQLWRIYSNSIEWTTTRVPSEGGGIETVTEGSSPLIDVMLEFFKNYPSSEGQKFFDNLFCITIREENGEEYEEYIGDEDSESVIRNYFGCYDHYRRFYETAFRS